MKRTVLPPKSGDCRHPIGGAIAAALLLLVSASAQQPTLQTPEQFFGFRMGTDNKLARWDKIVEYFKQVSGASDRIRESHDKLEEYNQIWKLEF